MITFFLGERKIDSSLNARYNPKRFGKLAGLSYINDHITHLMLRERHLWGKKIVSIPAGQIDRYQDNTVLLKPDKQAMEALPAIPFWNLFSKDRLHDAKD
jgi:hypothetical protein